MSNDQKTILRLLDGDPGAVATVRAWIRQALTPYRSRFAAEAEDIEQEILLDLTRALRDDRFRGRAQLVTYVKSCVHHKCIDRLRSQSRRQWIAIDDLELTNPSPSALDQLSDRQATELALRVIEEMPEPCREVWRLLRQGMRYREMSQVLGVPEGTLRARVLRCRRRALELRQKFSTSDATKPARRRLRS